MRKLIFATGNVNKLTEIRQILENHSNLDVIGLHELGYNKDIPETGMTLEENAIIKAEAIFKKYGTPCFAEDSGLEVFSLNKQPGVLSARYAGKTSRP